MKIDPAAILSASAFGCTCLSMGQAQQDLSKLGIEDLMQIEVTTASKQAQDLLHVPAAIYVITREQLHRAGATSIPEALRMAPGVDVAQIDANKWMISIRGFNSRFANKLLVLIDGRSIYTPLFSGVYWDTQDVNMEDIDRIEVIRGPGGTLWGANAVNGIINVITRNSKETQGFDVSGETSTSDPALTSVRYGGKLSPNAYYRVYGKYRRVKSLPSLDGSSGDDGWEASSGGIRTDWKSRGDSVSFLGGVTSLHEGQTSEFPSFNPPYSFLKTDRFSASNWNLMGHWQRDTGSGKGTEVRLSFDHLDHNAPEAGEKRDTLDIDFQQPVASSPVQQLIWGLGYRLTRDTTNGSYYVSFSPAKKEDHVMSGFIQDELALTSALRLSLGTKLEHNSYTGWEVQPSARLLWTKDKHQAVWASVTRAVRTPSRADTSSVINEAIYPGEGMPVEVRFVGNPAFKSESVIAHEIGWRYVPNDRLFVDVTAFYNRYNNLRTFDALEPYIENDPVPHVVLPYLYGNGLNAETGGLEAVSEYQAAPDWQLSGGISIFSSRFRFDGDPDAVGIYGADRQGITPRATMSIRSLLNLPKRVQFDTSLYFADKLDQGVAPYGRLDLRLGWKPTDLVELCVGARNLTNARHLEAVNTLFEVPGLIERSFYVRATIRF